MQICKFAKIVLLKLSHSFKSLNTDLIYAKLIDIEMTLNFVEFLLSNSLQTT